MRKVYVLCLHFAGFDKEPMFIGERGRLVAEYPDAAFFHSIKDARLAANELAGVIDFASIEVYSRNVED